MQRRSRSILPSLRREWAQTDQLLFGPSSLWLESRPVVLGLLAASGRSSSSRLARIWLEYFMSQALRFFALPLIVFLLATALAVQPAPGSKDDAAGVIAAKLQPMVAANTMAGAVTLVASEDKVLDLETVGYADVAAKKAMAPDYLFWIASMSKGMTAAAMMMLVDAGKVNVDDPVEKYLPESRGQMVGVEQDEHHAVLKKPQHPIKIRETLSHTAGCRSCRAFRVFPITSTRCR